MTIWTKLRKSGTVRMVKMMIFSVKILQEESESTFSLPSLVTPKTPLDLIKDVILNLSSWEVRSVISGTFTNSFGSLLFNPNILGSNVSKNMKVWVRKKLCFLKSLFLIVPAVYTEFRSKFPFFGKQRKVIK